MKTLQSNLLLISAFVSLAFLAGCKTVGRENIISTINTGIGATITENPQTQLYEVKLGFIRTQFYSVPTGKKVEGTNQTNDASQTPEVVSGIRANSGIEHLFLGMDVSESFAVGKIAVMSPAAIAMYVGNAKSPEAAKRAAEAASNLSYNTPENIKARGNLDELLKKKLKTSAQCGGKTADKFSGTEEYADCLANQIAPGKTLGYLRLTGGKHLDTLITQLQAAVEP